jgi:acyl-CoA reductase-like NAD-dependent aldehyde dehydrogenase
MHIAQNFIAGQWHNGASSFTRCSPRTGTPFSRIESADRTLVDSAVKAATTALSSWAALPIAERAGYLGRCAKWLEKQYGTANERSELKQLIMDEVGKPLPEADIEVIETSGFLQYFSDQSVDMLSDQILTLNTALWPTKASRVRFEPVGVVGVVKAWNYPLEIPLWSIAPALLAGNTIVFKPSEKSAVVATAIAKMFEAVGLPAGVINIVNGGADIGAAIAEHPKVAMVSFTGSVEAGRKVAVSCGMSLKKAALELGGNDAAIVTEHADPETAANGLVWGAFCNAGQVCVGIKRAYLHKEIADRVIRLVVEKVKTLRMDVDVGPLIDERQLRTVESFVNDAALNGGQIASGGKCASGRAGFFFEPTVILGLNNRMRIANEECFGPLLPIAIVKSNEDAIAEANSSEYGLGASIWTNDASQGLALAGKCKAGMVWINDVNVAFVEAPWGGVKHSGLGFELSADVLREYTIRKHINLEESHEARRAWWYPYGSL